MTSIAKVCVVLTRIQYSMGLNFIGANSKQILCANVCVRWIFDGNSLDWNLGVVFSSIIICLNGIFIMSAMCSVSFYCGSWFSLGFFRIFVHYLTFGIDSPEKWTTNFATANRMKTFPSTEMDLNKKFIEFDISLKASSLNTFPIPCH